MSEWKLIQPSLVKIAWAAIVALSLSAAHTAFAAKQSPLLARLTYGTGWEALPAIVAIERGFFFEEGLVISGTASTSVEAIANSLAVGSTDLVAVPQMTMLMLVDKGIPAKIIAIGGWGTDLELLVPATSPISRLEELRGRRIAVTPGSDALPVLVRLINLADLDARETKIIRLSTNDILNAFSANTADAVFETRHFTKTIADKFGARILVSADQLRERLGVINAMPLLASDRVIAQEPRMVQKAVHAWVKTMKYIEQNPDDAARLLQIYLHRQGIKAPMTLTSAWIGMTNYNRVVWSVPDTDDAKYNAWAAREVGQIANVPELGAFVDSRFAETALRQLMASGRPRRSQP